MAMLPTAMPRLGLALAVAAAAALIVVAAVLPEYQVQPDGFGVRALDPGRPGWVASLIGILVQAGLLLVTVLMLLLSDAKPIAGGILVGAGVIGLSLRLVRIVQLVETPGLDPAIGSWIDLLAEGSILSAGFLTVLSPAPEPEIEDLEDEPAPPAGESDPA